jgi:hypothetical protein
MPPKQSAQPPSGSGLGWSDRCWSGLAVSGYLALLALSGCETSGREDPRSEPWRKDEAPLSRAERQVDHYRAERGQFLTFSLKSKQGALRGRIPLSGAELTIDPRALDHSRGELVFDLAGLSVQAVSAENEGGAAFAEDPLLTRAARAWLSLGSEVSEKDRAEARPARFGIRLGRELSSHSIAGGQAVASGLRVSAIADGDLLLLGREVSHVVKVELDFLSSLGEGAKGAPASIVVRLSEAEAVPLSEHGILPRDERGAALAEEALALGRRANLRALVTGSLSFVRADR